MLAALHAGWFRAGRRGWPTRFEFRVSSAELRGLASGKIVVVAAEEPTKMLEHKFRGRPDLEITVELPSDLTKREASRVIEFPKTLPFDDAAQFESA
jgi:hypothetical protein